ncbi:alcohol dehydrogenase class-2 isozyme 1-like isoform X2 [Oncorhynchus nerka]|uniref:alcohol dehydrogenase class-2 isozyme 1-like isoform X2 n=1 Tax=Oncorhynchus nerka TaxID=8023 RepID=UPI0031B86673
MYRNFLVAMLCNALHLRFVKQQQQQPWGDSQLEEVIMNTESQVIKCKPAVAWEHGKPLSIERVEVAPPRAHKVCIKQVECATLTRGTSMRLVYACIPLVLGHKGSGVVEGVSPGVSKFSPGLNVMSRQLKDSITLFV